MGFEKLNNASDEETRIEQALRPRLGQELLGACVTGGGLLVPHLHLSQQNEPETSCGVLAHTQNHVNTGCHDCD